MTGILDRIAERAFEVTVAGEDVGLRYPLDEERAHVVEPTIAFAKAREAAREAGDDSDDESAENTREAVDVMETVMCRALAATVTDYAHFDEAAWKRILVASRIDPDKWDGLPELVRTACRMCGVQLRGDDGAEAETEVRDNVAAADETLGDHPTS